MKKIIHSCPLVSLTVEFIRKSKSGHRRYGNGRKISSGTIDNYTFLLKHLQGYEATLPAPLRIISETRLAKKKFLVEKNYWKKFFVGFTEYLHKAGCFDNYVGMMMKNVRAILKYAEDEKMIATATYRKELYVVKEEIPIITLLPERLQYIIYNEEFNKSLNPTLQEIRDVFVLGCTVALRYSDLIDIKWRNIEKVGSATYLAVSAQKTGAKTRIRLPDYAITILDKYAKQKRKNPTGRKGCIFPDISLSWFNIKVRELSEAAGWTEECGKRRAKGGKMVEILRQAQNDPTRRQTYRFCDLVSSHIMRRTAITTMLMNGVPEFMVRKISGHSANSAAFQRYVNLAQSYMDGAIEKHYERLAVPI